MSSELRARVLASRGMIVADVIEPVIPINSPIEPDSELMPLEDLPLEVEGEALPNFKIEFVPPEDALENETSSVSSDDSTEVETIFGRRVEKEELGQARYQPQLSVERVISEDSVTESAGRIVPILPATKEQE